eukprot:1411251-Pyramimonas_sp.AAC.1
MPGPSDAMPWRRPLVESLGAWASATACVHLSDSIADAQPAHAAGDAQALPYACPECHAGFPTTRALESHRRAKHK